MLLDRLGIGVRGSETRGLVLSCLTECLSGDQRSGRSTPPVEYVRNSRAMLSASGDLLTGSARWPRALKHVSRYSSPSSASLSQLKSEGDRVTHRQPMGVLLDGKAFVIAATAARSAGNRQRRYLTSARTHV